MANRDNNTRVKQTNVALSLKSADGENYPIAYAEDIWDNILPESELSKLMKDGAGQYDQHEINEILASHSGGTSVFAKLIDVEDKQYYKAVFN
ncbi:MAG: hypothetical protein IKR17_01000 [Bacteroidales bacterium]|nr:hypothetical protein [Bacteroidales bacterium]